MVSSEGVLRRDCGFSNASDKTLIALMAEDQFAQSARDEDKRCATPHSDVKLLFSRRISIGKSDRKGPLLLDAGCCQPFVLFPFETASDQSS